jgi:hypothetical protein
VLLPCISISEILDGEPCPFAFQAGILDHVQKPAVVIIRQGPALSRQFTDSPGIEVRRRLVFSKQAAFFVIWRSIGAHARL